VIPITQDDVAIATLEVPLADPAGSPKHVAVDYYYKIPVRPIYKSKGSADLLPKVRGIFLLSF
jgi:hypothetical protein